MSRLKGRVLPGDLLRRISQTGLPFEEVILMLTVDEESWPHVAMLGHWEVFAPNERTIRAATYLGSRTCNNLLRDGKVTLVFVNETMSYYVKGDARLTRERMSSDSSNSLFTVTVAQVYEDVLEGAGIKTGITFSKSSGVEPHEALFLELVAG
jgi:Pyridoxamine 5'-phosphate oxidase